jgi:hypothetical protein
LKLPGTPYWLAALLLAASMVIAWSVTRHAVREVDPAVE